jgi:hypothetical protein
MSEFAQQLYDFMFNGQTLQVGEQKYAGLVFVAGCGICGLLTVAGDICLFVLRKQSFLDFVYTWKNFFVLMSVWTLGAMISGFVGQIFGIFQINLLACLTAGLAWPLILVRLKKGAAEKIGPQEPSTAQQPAE